MKTGLTLLFASSLMLLASCSNTPYESKSYTYSNQNPKIAMESRSVASDSSVRASIEQWKGQNGLKFVYRNKDGLFKSWATLEFETWTNDDQSKWTARLQNGQFVTGYTGKTEKFKVGSDREELRVVIRNASGQFVAWKAIDDLVTAKFDAWDIDGDGNNETVYVIRYDGRFLNWAKANLEEWQNFDDPVLVVRDTADGTNNGKILSWIAPETFKKGPKKGQVYYKDPETGRFVSPNK